MSLSWEVPSIVIDSAKDFFPSSMIMKAKNLLLEGKISISFSKGDLENFFVVSGIVTDRGPHESKLKFKNASHGDKITSQCDCLEWSSHHHCPHTVGLYLLFHLKKMFEEEKLQAPFSLKEERMISYSSLPGVVTPDEYGIFIRSPEDLNGSYQHATYAALQYSLCNSQIVDFPVPEVFQGKIHFYFNFDSQHESNILTFLFEDPSNEKFEEVTFFEDLYLFNWKNGKVYSLPYELKETIQFFKKNSYEISPDVFLDFYFLNPQLKNFISLYFNQELIENLSPTIAYPRLILTSSEKKNNIFMTLDFHDDNQELFFIPDFLKAFCFEGGLLSSFKKKKDAYEFIKDLTDFFEGKSDNYKIKLLGNFQKSKWFHLIHLVTQLNETYRYNFKTNKLYVYRSDVLKDFIIYFFKAFGELAFRFSKFSFEERQIRFQLTAQSVFQGISFFFSKMEKHSLEIFYGNLKVQRWNSRMTFERKFQKTNWFDLELNISSSDLEIIKNSKIENNLAMTPKGLVLLDSDQKELLKFVQKHIQEENLISDENEEKTVKARYKISFQRAQIFELFELKKLGLDGALTPEEDKMCENLLSLEKIPHYQIPHNLESVLRPYQKTAFHWLNFLYEYKLGACLADDMGLGKTLQTLSFLESIEESINQVLVVCPVSLLLNWQNEIEKFTNLSCFIFHGNSKDIPPNKKVILTSYGLIRKEAAESFKDLFFDILVLDEVHQLKNYRSLGAQAIRKIQTHFRICLTGTPVENDLAEFYNIIDLSVPGIWGDLRNRISTLGKGRQNAKKMAAPFILRRTKDNVLKELPPKIENDVLLSLSPKEKNRYQETLENIKEKIQQSHSKRRYGEILKGLLELRQRCLWQTEGKSLIHYSSTKIHFLLETLEQILEEGHQAIVFSQFTTYLDIIQSFISERHWKFSRIDGRQTIKTRQKQVENFQEKRHPLFLISLKAGGVGLNLTAASYVFIMDPWWNPAVESQAIDRAYRIGQKNTLTVYRPIIKDSVEEKILDLQKSKKQLFNDLLPNDDENLFSGKLSMKDFEYLLS